jgi:hypothetical protein
MVKERSFPSSIQIHTHILFPHFFLFAYYFHLWYMIKLYFSCFLVHSQYNVIMIGRRTPAYYGRIVVKTLYTPAPTKSCAAFKNVCIHQCVQKCVYMYTENSILSCRNTQECADIKERRSISEERKKESYLQNEQPPLTSNCWTKTLYTPAPTKSCAAFKNVCIHQCVQKCVYMYTVRTRFYALFT